MLESFTGVDKCVDGGGVVRTLGSSALWPRHADHVQCRRLYTGERHDNMQTYRVQHKKNNSLRKIKCLKNYKTYFAVFFIV